MNALTLYRRFSKWPCGRYLFSKLFCFKAPYFGTIHPYFEELEPGRCVIQIKKRRSVQNHIGTVHAIAMCNMAEAAAGLCVEVSLPKNLRWIPKGMEVEYLRKANSNLRGVCEFDPTQLKAGINDVHVDIKDREGEKVFHARITMYISEKKA